MKRGFSLLEIALAIALMAIAILAIILVFTRGMSLMSASSRVTKASEFGRQFLEVVRVGGPAGITLGSYDGRLGQAADPTTGFPPAPYPRPPQDDSFALVVEATDTGVPPGTIGVKVDVYWDQDSKISLQTYVLQ